MFQNVNRNAICKTRGLEVARVNLADRVNAFLKHKALETEIESTHSGDDDADVVPIAARVLRRLVDTVFRQRTRAEAD